MKSTKSIKILNNTGIVSAKPENAEAIKAAFKRKGFKVAGGHYISATNADVIVYLNDGDAIKFLTAKKELGV